MSVLGEHARRAVWVLAACLGAVLTSGTRGQPAVVLSVDRTTIREHQAVTLTATPSARLPGLMYRFDFGDGTPTEWTSDLVVMHPYERGGQFKPSVEIGRDRQAITKSRDAILITVQPAPRVTLSPSTTEPEAGDEITLKAVFEGPAPANARYFFDYGDLTSDLLNEPRTTHTYGAAGSYSASLTVTVGGEFYASAKVPIRVREAAPVTRPRVTLSPSTTEPRVGEEITLKAVFEGQAPANARYLFDYGDQTSDLLNEPRTTHTYGAARSYGAALTVTVDDAVYAADKLQIQVSAADPAVVVVGRTGGWSRWWLVGIPLVVVPAAWWMWRTLRRPNANRGGAGTEMKVRAVADRGTQRPGSRVDVGVEVRLRPVADPGTHRLECRGDLVLSEGSDHGGR